MADRCPACGADLDQTAQLTKLARRVTRLLRQWQDPDLLERRLAELKALSSPDSRPERQKRAV